MTMTPREAIEQDAIQYSKPFVKRKEKTKSDYKAESFVKEIKSNGYNLTKAYKKVINPSVTDKTAATSGSRLLRSEGVQALLQPLEKLATDSLYAMIKDTEHKDSFNASKLALAYLHGTPVARSENVNVNVSVEDILRPSEPL